jgi:hypothetical protein
LAQDECLKRIQLAELVLANGFIRDVQISENLTDASEVKGVFRLEHLFGGDTAHHIREGTDEHSHLPADRL